MLQTLAVELNKVSKFYDALEAQLLQQLEASNGHAGSNAPEHLSRLHQQVQDLTKYAALNYVAVLKAIKKRNRRLRDACGDQVVTVAPYSILKHQAFFTSRRLPRITQRAKELHEVRSALFPGLHTCALALTCSLGSCCMTCAWWPCRTHFPGPRCRYNLVHRHVLLTSATQLCEH